MDLIMKLEPLNADIKPKELEIKEDINEQINDKVTLDLGNGKVFYFTPDEFVKDFDLKDIKKENFNNRCSHCEKSFVNQKTLEQHITSQHFGVRLRCPDCDKDYDNKANLNRHIKAIHEGIGYQCEECEHVSSDYSNMKRHKRLHSSELEMFDCTKCDFQCNDKGNLKSHMKRMHLRDGPRKKSRRRKTLPIQ